MRSGLLRVCSQEVGSEGSRRAGKELSKGEDSVGGEPQADSTGSSGV